MAGLFLFSMNTTNILPRIKKNILLKNYTTFHIGGPARYFLVAKTKEDLIKAVSLAKKNNLPFFILGGGSNVLISDKGFNGLIIKNEARNFKIKKETIIAESGTILSQLINTSVKAGLSGLVEGAGIPGTIGGAVYSNAGWPRGKWSIGNIVKEVEVLIPNGKIKKVNKKWMEFEYRNSRLKKMRNKKSIILQVILELKKGKKTELEKKLREILKIRSKKIPKGFSAGSIFKNPRQKTAGFLIEKSGFKGKKIGNAQISKKHANFIINLGKAKAGDVKKLIKLIKKEVKKEFKKNLKEEIEYLGF